MSSTYYKCVDQQWANTVRRIWDKNDEIDLDHYLKRTIIIREPPQYMNGTPTKYETEYNKNPKK